MEWNTKNQIFVNYSVDDVIMRQNIHYISKCIPIYFLFLILKKEIIFKSFYTVCWLLLIYDIIYIPSFFIFWPWVETVPSSFSFFFYIFFCILFGQSNNMFVSKFKVIIFFYVQSFIFFFIFFCDSLVFMLFYKFWFRFY